MEFREHKKLLRPTWEEVFQAFDDLDLGDFEIERDTSLPRDISLHLSNEDIDSFLKWVSGFRKADSLQEGQTKRRATANRHEQQRSA